MKRREFKELVKEAMLEILPELMEIMVENLNEGITPASTKSVQQKPDLSLVRQHFSSARGSDKGYDLDEFAPKRRVSNVPAPSNPKAVIDGEHFASGQGIMEWYKKTGGQAEAPSEFKHSSEDMDNFLAKKFGVK